MFLLYFISFLLYNNYNEGPQKNDLEWNSGMVFLLTGESFEGDMSFTYYTNVLFCRVDNKVLVFHAHEVKLFHIYDPLMQRNKVFVSKKFQGKKNKLRTEFVEIVILGDIPVFRKPNFNKKIRMISPEFTDYSYYAKIGEQYVHLKDFRKKIFPVLIQNFRSEIDDFIRETNLNPSKLTDKIRLISFYNSAMVGLSTSTLQPEN